MEDITLKEIGRLYNQSKQKRSTHEARWARNLKLLKGIPVEDKTTFSEIRKRNKIFYRKIWSISWRLVSALYGSIIKDSQNFKISGRDGISDPVKASVLQEMVQYRIDRMYNSNNLFIKHIWSLKNIVDMGWCVGKLSWQFNPSLNIDDPSYTVYPLEQVYPDFSAETKDKMRYIIFENYMTKSELIENGYENIEEARPEQIPSSQLRAVRNVNKPDPISNYTDNEYPEQGSVTEEQDDNSQSLYCVWESFRKKDGKWKFCVSNRDKVVFRKEMDSPYGDVLPAIMGLCLSESHQLIGEGLPEPLEGPQESYNYILNMRKDNVALAMNPPTKISRYGNVDINALINRGPRKGVLMDDINAVQEMDVKDVTRSAYLEADVDNAMLEDVSGVTAAIQGIDKSGTATQSQINLNQGAAKIDLYINIVAETYYKDFILTLAKMIQRFETNENIFRVANQNIGAEGIYDIDFDADVRLNVSPNIGREQEIRQLLLILDRGAIYNQAQIQLLQIGAVPSGGIKLFNGAQVFADLMPKLGKNEIEQYFVTIPPIPPQTNTGTSSNSAEALAGLTQPQQGNLSDLMPQNDLQSGGYGGY